jgi:hypothetical protein
MTSKNQEISPTIKGYDDYTISSQGDVYSYRRNKPLKLKLQKATQSKKKYLQVRIFNKHTLSKTKVDKNGKPCNVGKLQYIHRLVWEAFVGEIPKGMTIDHIDGNPNNNNLNNLQLLSSRDNTIRHYNRDGNRYLRKERDAMIKAYEELKTYTLVAKKFDCAVSSVYRVIKNIKFPSGKKKDLHISTFDNTIDDKYATEKAYLIKKEHWD